MTYVAKDVKNVYKTTGLSSRTKENRLRILEIIQHQILFNRVKILIPLLNFAIYFPILIRLLHHIITPTFIVFVTESHSNESHIVK